MKHIELTPRLRMVADMIPTGAVLADVGTDHAYLPAALMMEGKLNGAIAADLREVGAKTVALLPFHRLAVGKYEAMGIPYPYRDTPPLSAETLRRTAEILSKDFTVYTEK